MQPGYEKDSAVPMVLDYHGWTGSAQGQEKDSKVNSLQLNLLK